MPQHPEPDSAPRTLNRTLGWKLPTAGPRTVNGLVLEQLEDIPKPGKQVRVRDYLIEIGWNKEPPAPELPPEVVEKTREKYVEAFRRLTGRELAS